LPGDDVERRIQENAPGFRGDWKICGDEPSIQASMNSEAARVPDNVLPVAR
jgi:hypothetical protein